MCNFIILLLLLGNTGRRCGRNCGCSNNDYRRDNDNDYGRRNDGDCGCDDDDYRRDNDDYRRRNDRDCGCSACEDSTSDTSPIMEREDIWSTYMNASPGRQNK